MEEAGNDKLMPNRIPVELVQNGKVKSKQQMAKRSISTVFSHYQSAGCMVMKELLRTNPFDNPHITIAHSLRKIGSMNYQAKTTVHIMV